MATDRGAAKDFATIYGLHIPMEGDKSVAHHQRRGKTRSRDGPHHPSPLSSIATPKQYYAIDYNRRDLLEDTGTRGPRGRQKKMGAS